MNKQTLAQLLVFAVILPAAPLVSAQSNYFQAVTNLNPAAYWPMQETTLPPVADVETNLGSLGAVANAYYSSTNVVKGFNPATGDGVTADSFPSGVNGSFLAVPLTSSQVSVPVGPFTVEAWIYPTNAAATIVAQTGPTGTGGLNAGTNSAGWSLNQNYLPYLGTSAYANSLIGWSFHVYNGVGATGGAEADAVYNFNQSQWYHVVGVFDGVNCTVYVNGVNATTSQIPMTGSYVQDLWSPLTIACGRGLNNNRFGGALNEVAVYTKALSPTQISSHYNAEYSGSYATTILGDSPYMYWRLDAPAYVTPTTPLPAAASYGSANAGGIYLPGVTPGVAGPAYPGFGNMTNACAFNGIGTDATNAVATFTNSVAFNSSMGSSGILITNLDNALNLKSNNITAMVWFKANPVDDWFQGLLGHSDSSWRLALDGAAGKVHWNPGEGGELTSTKTYNDGQWHFAAGVYLNGGTFATGTNYLYVDGELDTSGTVTTAATGSTTNVLLGGAPDYCPSGNGNIYRNRFFSGSLAHAAYFTNALTSSQIASLYTNATGGIIPPPFITVQPATGRTVAAGTASLNFNVTAGGTALTYQWYFNSSSNYSGATALVSGAHYLTATAAQLTIANLVGSDTGYYFVIATNNFGSVTSLVASLNVSTNPVITAQTPSGAFSLFPNQNLTLSVTATGGTPLTFQWYTNGVADTSAGLTATYSVANAQISMSGETYQCIVANSYGLATNLLATLTVNPYPASLASSSYSSYLLSLSPTAYWPMHKSAPQAMPDMETNYGTLGAAGSAYYSDWVSPITSHQVPGAIAGDANPAVTFYNTNGDCLIVPHSSPQATIQGPFTLEAWVKPFTDNSLGTSYQVIMGQGGIKGLNGSASVGGFALQYGGSPSTFSLVIWNGTATPYEQKTSANYPPGVWYHVVTTFDGTNVNYYINNQLDDYGTLQSGVPMPMAPDSWSPLCVGAGRWTTTGAQQPFIGSMDEVAVYTNVLNTTQINNHYVAGTTVGGNYKQTVLGDKPLMYYRMDSPAYVQPPVSTWPVLTNYGSTALNGVYHPGAIPGGAAGPNVGGFSVTNLGINAMQGNGVSGFADAGIAPTLNLGGITSFSYSAWFKGNPGDGRNLQDIMAVNDGSWRAQMNSSGKLQVHGSGSGDLTSPLSYNDGNWHQMVVTAQGVLTNATIGVFTNILYVDGVPVTSNAGGGTNTPAIYPAEVLIGDEMPNTNSSLSGAGRAFAGSICEAAFFYGTALSSDQVLQLYNAANVPPTIVSQPATGRTQNAGAGTYIYFGVVASGTPSLAYQWYYNSSPAYTGATALMDGSKYSFAATSQVTVTNLAGSDTGYYFVVITNNYGSVTSALASLNVLTTPVFTTQLPVTYTNFGSTNLMTIFAGANPSFSASATGPAPISYQWFTNGVAAGGITANGGCALTSVQGNFTAWCVANNSYGSTTSSVWSASVVAAPVSTYPQAVMASHPVGYWRFNEPDDNLSDGNPNAVCFDSISGNDGIYTNVDLGQGGYGANQSSGPETSALFGQFSSGINNYVGQIQGVDFAAPTGTTTNFSVEVWVNGFSGMTTGDAVVSKGVYSLNDAFVIDISSASGHPYRFYVRTAAGGVINVGSTLVPDSNWHHLVGVCDETDGFIYLYVDGVQVGKTAISTTAGLYEPNYTMSVGSVQNASETGTYSLPFKGYMNDLALYNYALSAAQVSAHFSASGSAPVISQQPVSTTNVNYGGTLIVPAAAAGSIQWYDSNAGTGIPGQTNGTLVVSNITASDSYYFIVTNRYGPTTSSSVYANVIAGGPQLYADIAPLNWSTYAGKPVTFSVTAYGSAPLYYKWFLNGSVISAATNASYIATTPLGTNLYSCVVSNAFNGGSVAGSSTATLSGVTAPTDTYSLAVLSNNPIAYWRLNESSGSIANDYIGGHDASYTNVLLGVAGNDPSDPDTAAEFGDVMANNSFAREIDNSIAGLANIDFSGESVANFSVEAWVKGGSSQISGAGLVAKGYSGNEQFCLDYFSNGYRFFIHDNVNVLRTCQSTNALDGNWHHVVGVCDELDGVMHLYVDGADVADLSGVQAGKSVLATSPGTLSAASLVSIGSRAASKTATTFTEQFVGSIDDVAIYNTALTASQVAAHYQAGVVVPPAISLAPAGNLLRITYTGTLLYSTNAAGPFFPVAGANSPYTTPATNAQMFYRAGN